MPSGIYKRTEEHNRKNRICHQGKSSFKGKHHTDKAKMKMSLARTGTHPTEETKKKMSLTRKGNKNHFFGKHHSRESKEKISSLKKGVNTGKNHWKWIKDRTLIKQGDQEKRSPKYKEWRRKICNRDNWKCKINNQDCKGRLEVHHILSYTDYPELRYSTNNGITLCHAHHPRKRAEEKQLISIFTDMIVLQKE